MKYELGTYEHGPNDRRIEVRILEGAGWIPYITANGSGQEVIARHAGEIWREGPEEMIGSKVYETEEDARAALG